MNRNRITIIAVLAYCCVIVYSHLMRYSLPIGFSPFNGAFQTYNPMRHLDAGRTVFRDFVCYTGYGSLVLTYLSTKLLGGRFVDSYIGTAIVSHLIFFLPNVWLAWRISESRLTALATAFTIDRLVTWISNRPAELGKEVLSPLLEMAETGQSMLAIRGALPILIAALLWPRRDASWLPFGDWRRRDTLRWILAAGIAPFWSNDYGIIVFGHMLLCLGLVFLRPAGRAGRRDVFLLGGSVLATPVIVGFLLPRFSLIDWFRYNYLGVARDQGWYFRHNPTPVSVLEFHPIYILFCAVIVSSLVFVLLSRNDRRRRALIFLFPMAITCWGSFLSTFGGHGDPRYFRPALRVVLVAFIAILPAVIDQLAGRMRRILKRPPTQDGSERRSAFLRAAFGVLIAAPGLALFAPHPVERLHDFHDQWSKTPAFFACPELGTNISAVYERDYAWGKRLRADRTLNDHDWFSTYSTLTESIAGIFNPTKFDYIIHALGDTNRDAFAAALKASNPRYVQVLRSDLIYWDNWCRFQNWELFRHIYAHYDAIDMTPQHFVFERRSAPRADLGTPIEVSEGIVHDSYAEYTFHIPEAIAKDLSGPIICDVAVDITLVRNAPRFDLTALKADFGGITSGDTGVVTFGLPSKSGVIHRPVVVDPKFGGFMHISLRPEKKYEMTTRIVGAVGVVAVADTRVPALRFFVTSTRTDDAFDRGISLRRPEDVYFRKPVDIQGLAVGMVVNFAKGPRRIRAIRDTTITFDGPVDPATAGFPVFSGIERFLELPVTEKVRRSATASGNGVSILVPFTHPTQRWVLAAGASVTGPSGTWRVVSVEESGVRVAGSFANAGDALPAAVRISLW